jgi:type IV secretion system protein VirB10
MQLRQGIPINQSPPSVYRANRRPLYIAIGTVGIVSILLIWAWVVRSNRRVIVQAKPTSSVAAPATSALKTLDKQWSEKLPKPPEMLSPLISSHPQVAQTAPALEARNMRTYDIPATSAGFSVPPPPQIPVEQQPPPPSEERSAWDSPMVASRQALPHQEAQAAAPPPVAAPPTPLLYPHPAGGDGSPGEDYLSQNLQDSKKAFAGVGRNTFVPIAADGGRLPPYIVKAGWDIPAILEQSANSDLPGDLRARVRENVYDTATGRYLLIPQNSILAGKYNSDVAYAQNRIQVNWDRLIRPGNEPTIYLNQMNGVDDSGNAGLTGPVNNHYRRLIGFALLSSAFAAGIEVSQTRNNSGFG